LLGKYFSWAKHSRGYLSEYDLDRNACKTTQGQIHALVVLKPGEQTVPIGQEAYVDPKSYAS